MSCPTNDIAHEDFVFCWQTSNSPEEVAAKLSKIEGKPVSALAVLAMEESFRHQGVNLR